MTHAMVAAAERKHVFCAQTYGMTSVEDFNLGDGFLTRPIDLNDACRLRKRPTKTEISPNEAATFRKTLVVGDVETWQSSGQELPFESDLDFADFATLADLCSQRALPDIVLSSLMHTKCDAFEISTILGNVGYSGSYHVIAGPLPDKTMIERELQKAAPKADIKVLVSVAA